MRSPTDPPPEFLGSSATTRLLRQATRASHRDRVLILGSTGSAPSLVRLIDRCRLQRSVTGGHALDRIADVAGVELFADLHELGLCPHEALVVDVLDPDADPPTFVTRAETQREWVARVTPVVGRRRPSPNSGPKTPASEPVPR